MAYGARRCGLPNLLLLITRPMAWDLGVYRVYRVYRIYKVHRGYRVYRAYGLVFGL